MVQTCLSCWSLTAAEWFNTCVLLISLQQLLLQHVVLCTALTHVLQGCWRLLSGPYSTQHAACTQAV